MTSLLNLSLSLVAMLAMQPAFGHHVELPQGMTQAQATWLWGHHSIPADITLSGTAYWYVYPHTDVNAITNPVWSDVAAKHILAAIGEKDLWAKGASCNTKTHARGSNSVVVKDAPHGMSDRPEVGKAVDDFIKAVTGS